MTKPTTGTRHSYALASDERLVLRFTSRADCKRFVNSSNGTVFTTATHVRALLKTRWLYSVKWQDVTDLETGIDFQMCSY